MKTLVGFLCGGFCAIGTILFGSYAYTLGKESAKKELEKDSDNKQAE